MSAMILLIFVLNLVIVAVACPRLQADSADSMGSVNRLVSPERRLPSPTMNNTCYLIAKSSVRETERAIHDQ